MDTVIHLNENSHLLGGVEVYLEQLQRLLPNTGWQSLWFGVKRSGQKVKILSHDKPEWTWVGSVSEFKTYLASGLCGGGVLHVHSMSDPYLIRAAMEVAPVVRTMHEPRMVCPGHGKFWLNSETPCPVPWGWHCLYHAYQQKCCHRNPRALFKAMMNTRFENENAHRYAAIIANSHFIRNGALQCGMPPKNMVVIHYFAEAVDGTDTIPGSEQRILFAGRLSRTKGVHYLLDAFAKVIERFPHARLDIAGSGIHEHEFQTRATQLQLEKNTVFYGWSDRLAIQKLFKASSIVAFPSIYPEAFGIVGIEAMMYGRPVIAFDVGGVRDWMDDGTTGILVQSKDTIALAGALIRLLENKSERLRMGRAARSQALNKFSVETHLKSLTSIYEKAIKSKGGAKG